LYTSGKKIPDHNDTMGSLGKSSGLICTPYLLIYIFT
jgi:hypothetical protein